MAGSTALAGTLPHAAARRLPRLPLSGFAAAAAWIALAGTTYALPEEGDFPFTATRAVGALGLGPASPVLTTFSGHLGRTGAALACWTPWLTLSALALLALELITAEFTLLPMPFFPPPQAILEVFWEDWPKLGSSILTSLKLLAGGYVIGAGLGFVPGVAIGSSRAVGRSAHPVLCFVGPLPATAWLPLAFLVFPSSWSASTFLIALATGFPVTVLTWSGVAGTDKA